jgi:F0F1-type ATP synthase assembly protein I
MRDTDNALQQAIEFAAVPVLLGLVGWLIDSAAGTGPLFLIALACFGVVGSFASFYYRYQAETAKLDEGKPWTRRTR